MCVLLCLCGVAVLICSSHHLLRTVILPYQSVEDVSGPDTSGADPLHAISKTHMCRVHANARPCMSLCIKCCHTLSLSCRMHLATPPRASACSAQQATANRICSSAMPPTTCREFWVATPLGWVTLTPPCCKPSSVRVRVMMHACIPVSKACSCGFADEEWVAKWLEECFLLCVCQCVYCSCSHYCTFPPTGFCWWKRRKTPRPSTSSPSCCLHPPVLPPLSAIWAPLFHH